MIDWKLLDRAIESGIVRGAAEAGRRSAFPILLFVLVAAGPLRPAAVQTQTGDKAAALSDAARRGDAAAVKKLLDEGVDVNTRFRYERTALSFAADRGHADVVEVLLDRGADANIKDTFYGATPLACAVSPAMDRTPQHTEVVRLLLARGRIPAEALADALAAATRQKLDDVVALLEKAGAKPK